MACPTPERAAITVYHRCAVHKHAYTREEMYTVHLRQQICIQKDGRGEGKSKVILSRAETVLRLVLHYYEFLYRFDFFYHNK